MKNRTAKKPMDQDTIDKMNADKLNSVDLAMVQEFINEHIINAWQCIPSKEIYSKIKTKITSPDVTLLNFSIVFSTNIKLGRLSGIASRKRAGWGPIGYKRTTDIVIGAKHYVLDYNSKDVEELIALFGAEKKSTGNITIDDEKYECTSPLFEKLLTTAIIGGIIEESN